MYFVFHHLAIKFYKVQVSATVRAVPSAMDYFLIRSTLPEPSPTISTEAKKASMPKRWPSLSFSLKTKKKRVEVKML